MQDTAPQVAPRRGTTIKEILEIQITHGIWTAENFAHHEEPILGIIEEIGEGIAHPILKRAQRIRDMDKPEVFRAALEDGIADVGIYLLHLTRMEGVTLGEAVHYEGMNDRELIAEMSMRAGAILSSIEERKRYGAHAMRRDIEICAIAIWCALNTIAAFHGDTLQCTALDCIATVWDRVVSKRNWKANASTGVQ